jgi:hypothetical protein
LRAKNVAAAHKIFRRYTFTYRNFLRPFAIKENYLAVVAASTKSEHVEKSTLKKQHKGVFKTLNGEAEKFALSQMPRSCTELFRASELPNAVSG